MWACHHLSATLLNRTWSCCSRSLYSDSIFKEWVSWVRLMCNVEVLSPYIRLGTVLTRAESQLTFFPGRGLRHRVQPTSDLKGGLGFLLLPPRAKQGRRESAGPLGTGWALQLPTQGQQCFPAPHTPDSRLVEGTGQSVPELQPLADLLTTVDREEHTPHPRSLPHTACEWSPWTLPFQFSHLL